MDRDLIVITGASGYLGQLLICALQKLEPVPRIIGIDIIDPPAPATGWSFRRIDVRSDLSEVFADADVVVHLAVVVSSRDRSAMQSTNVWGTQNVVQTAHKCGVRRTIYMSSILAYGPQGDEVPIGEETRLRPHEDLPYGMDKAESENWIEHFRQDHPDADICVLRPTFVVGPGSKRPMARLAELPAVPAIVGHDPRFQFVHEDDVIAVLLAAINGDIGGTLNVAPSDSLRLSDLALLAGRPLIAVPEGTVRAAAKALWALGILDLADGWVQWLKQSTVVRNDRLARDGYTFNRTSAEAFTASAAAHGKRLTVGRLSVRKSHLAVAAAGCVLAAGAVIRSRERPIGTEREVRAR